eukprot:4675431-Prymnesium_polylepis.1
MAMECFDSSMCLDAQSLLGWVGSTNAVYTARRNLVHDVCLGVNNQNLFCRCEGCAALPERPMWMQTPAAL